MANIINIKNFNAKTVNFGKKTAATNETLYITKLEAKLIKRTIEDHIKKSSSSGKIAAAEFTPYFRILKNHFDITSYLHIPFGYAEEAIKLINDEFEHDNNIIDDYRKNILIAEIKQNCITLKLTKNMLYNIIFHRFKIATISLKKLTDAQLIELNYKLETKINKLLNNN